MTLVRSFASLALLSACSAEPLSRPVAEPHAEPAPASEPAHEELFAFRSGFWLNLHQWLHYAATGRRPPPESAPPQPTDEAWTAAVAYYKARFGERGGFGLVFDEELVALNRRLSDLGSGDSLDGVDEELATHLRAAAALVRGDWEARDEANRRWVAAIEPRLAEHGALLRGDLAAFYAAPWPEAPIRVDVSCFAGPVGAYTVSGPPHTTVSSCDPAYAGEAALEMIFHEASHLLVEPIEQAIDAAAKARGREPPRQLWHAVLFYSTGAIVKRRLGDAYVPYAYANGLWERGPFSGFEPALRAHWQPHLDGAVDRDHAIATLVDATP
jgi:hypothetical protein